MKKPYGPAQTNNGEVWETLVNQAGEHFAAAERLREKAETFRKASDFGPIDRVYLADLYADSDRELTWGHAMSTHALNYRP